MFIKINDIIINVNMIRAATKMVKESGKEFTKINFSDGSIGIYNFSIEELAKMLEPLNVFNCLPILEADCSKGPK